MTVGTYRNPLLPGFNPDPSITYVPDKGYFICTSTFEFWPGLPIYHSNDLVNWKLIGHAINRRSQGVDLRTVDPDAGLWAPTIRYHQNRWYVTCVCFGRLDGKSDPPMILESPGFYVSTDDIFQDSAWSDAVFFDERGFDQDLLFDDDGKTYLTTTRFEFKPSMKIVSYSCQIDIATGRSLTKPTLTKDSSLGTAEGCHILKKDGWYYLFSAEGGTQDGHQEWVYRSRKPLGPWETAPAGVNPIVYNGTHPDIQNTGHMDLVKGHDDRWWAVFLGVRPVFQQTTQNGVPLMPSHLGRETFMAPVEWIDGWPVVNEKKPIELLGLAKGLKWVEDPNLSWRDDFDSKDLSLGWYSVRAPLKPCFSLTERPGMLAIRGSGFQLGETESPAILLRKQPGFDVDWATEMEFAPTETGEEAGVVLWLKDAVYATLSIRGVADGQKVELVFKSPNETFDLGGKFSETSFPLDQGSQPITFHIKCRSKSYEFAYATAGSNKRVVAGTIASDLFKPLFTGVQIGLFAQGSDHRACLTSAYVRYTAFSHPQES